MATLSANAPTLLDVAKRKDPSGRIARIVEILMQTNEMLIDMPWREGNLEIGDQTTIRTGLPSVFWRLINQGVTPSKSTTAQVVETTGMLEAWSEVDVDLANLSNNAAAFRASEATAFIEAMNQEMQSTVIYGNGGLAPEEFTGLAVRYSDLSAPNGANIVDAEGTQDSPSDLTSIWLVGWGDQTVTGIYPKGSTAGLVHNDYGEVTVEMTNGIAGARMRAYQERYQWKAGISVKDWRYVVRIANIDISDVDGMSPPDLVDLMERAQELIPNRLGRMVWYMNRTLKTRLRRQARTDVSAGGGLTYENFDGKDILSFGGVPIRTVDAILNTETVVS